MEDGRDEKGPAPDGLERRRFLGAATGGAMAAGLIASYGTIGVMAGRFLYPAHGTRKAWLFVTEVGRLRPGDSMRFRAPGGATVAIARRGRGEAAEDFLALSDICPHLGCKVHWEAQNNRFFCPCHNGAFDPEGRAIAGPPADANQSLPRYPLEVRNGLLFIEVPVEGVQMQARLERPGHDGCLGPRAREDRPGGGEA